MLVFSRSSSRILIPQIHHLSSQSLLVALTPTSKPSHGMSLILPNETLSTPSPQSVALYHPHNRSCILQALFHHPSQTLGMSYLNPQLCPLLLAFPAYKGSSDFLVIPPACFGFNPRVLGRSRHLPVQNLNLILPDVCIVSFL